MYLFAVALCLIFSFFSISCASEGSECVSEDGLTGICTDIHKCMQYVKILKDKNRPQVCSYKNQIPLVCCTDCELVNDTSNVLVNRNGLHYFKTGSKAQDKCLEYVIDQPYPCHLWGGVQRYLDDDEECYTYSITSILAAAGQIDSESPHPHMALLGYGDDLKTARWLCAGSLISHRFVLTAAHCIYNYEVGVGALNYIALGLTGPTYQWDKYNVSTIRAHTDYKETTSYYDIALVQSDKWIKFTHLVSPACLNTVEGDETIAFATGLASKDLRRGMSDSIVTVVLTAFTEAECTAYHPSHTEQIYGFNQTLQMCYGNYANNKLYNDFCKLDIGGSLHVHSDLSSCAHTLIGVASHGYPCGSSGVYTRVSYFVPWIESIVWT